MLNYCVHPEKIPEGNKRFKIKIMEERHVLGPVDDLFMRESCRRIASAESDPSNIAHKYSYVY